MGESLDLPPRGTISQLKLSLTRLNMDTAMTNWIKKYLPLGKSGNAKAELMEIFPHLFKGIGMLQRKYSIEFKNDTKAVHLSARNVPETLCKPYVDRMVKMGVITPVNEATN